MTMWTPTANVEGFSQIFKEQSGEKKLLGCVYIPNSNNVKVENFLDFLIFELCIPENEKVRKTVLVCTHGAQVESFEQRK